MTVEVFCQERIRYTSVLGNCIDDWLLYAKAGIPRKYFWEYMEKFEYPKPYSKDR